MSKFRKFTFREVPSLNTASLPDLVFSTLFFFMILTTMRTVSLQTQFDIPAVSELQKLEEKSRTTYIMVGYLPGNSGKTDVLIQLDNELVALEEISSRLENQNKQVAVLKIDKNTHMGLVQDIKQQLRQAGILTIHYSARKISPKMS